MLGSQTLGSSPLGVDDAQVVNLVGGTTTQQSTSSVGAVTVAPPLPSTINLTGSSSTQTNNTSSGIVAVVASAPNTINLIGTPSTQTNQSSTGVISIAGAGNGLISVSDKLVVEYVQQRYTISLE
jgi:hypothetical protein